MYQGTLYYIYFFLEILWGVFAFILFQLFWRLDLGLCNVHPKISVGVKSQGLAVGAPGG